MNHPQIHHQIETPISITTQSETSRGSHQPQLQPQQELELEVANDANDANDANPSDRDMDRIPNANDLDAILEKQMEAASIQRQQDLEIQIQTEAREHSILKFYIFVLVQLNDKINVIHHHSNAVIL